jgi:hypothetical protein
MISGDFNVGANITTKLGKLILGHNFYEDMYDGTVIQNFTLKSKELVLFPSKQNISLLLAYVRNVLVKYCNCSFNSSIKTL